MLSSILVNRLTGLGFILALSVGAVDFAHRIVDHEEASVAQQSLPAIAFSPALPSLEPQVREQLTALYDKYDSKARKEREAQAEQQTEKASVNTDAPEQSDIDAQNGELLSLLTNSSTLSLKAVIEDDKQYALIELVDHNSKASTYIRLKEGDEFEGFVVTELRHTSVALARGAQRIELMMYKIK